jgi:hypothetical protein
MFGDNTISPCVHLDISAVQVRDGLYLLVDQIILFSVVRVVVAFVGNVK